MRSYLLRGDRKCIPPEKHDNPYAKGVDGPITWDAYVPYTNVLWLAYIYLYLTENFQGEKKQLTQFKRTTREMWVHLNPSARADTPIFGSAGDVVRFAIEAGWIHEEQLVGFNGSTLLAEHEDSIIISRDVEDLVTTEMDQPALRRSPRRKQR
jgi:serine/threonine-protein kinase haspin